MHSKSLTLRTSQAPARVRLPAAPRTRTRQNYRSVGRSRWRIGDDGKPAQSPKTKRTRQKRTDVLVEHLRVAEHALEVLDPADVPGACAGPAPGGAEDSDAAKAPIGWSKSMAYQNMRFIDVTLDVFHAPMSSLKSVEK